MTRSLDPTRRDFLAASAAGFFGLAGAKTLLSSEPPMDDELLYVGTYTEGDRSEGIFVLRMDTGSGELRSVDATSAGKNPSFLAIHPNGRVLYAVNEVGDYSGKASGAVGAFAIDDGSGRLTRLNHQASEGKDPCYVSVERAGRAVLVANYSSGSV